MTVIGMAGRAGAGKDTVADFLVAKHGFKKFSFSDALYEEVSRAYGVPVEFLRDRDFKDQPTTKLSLKHCADNGFVEVATQTLDEEHRAVGVGLLLLPSALPLSPRWVLQVWGTEYRRAQYPAYWLNRAAEWMKYARTFDGVTRFVNTSVRFRNEAEFIRGCGGVLWHVMRDDLPPMDNASHESEKPLPIRAGSDEVIYNTGTLEHLEGWVDVAIGKTLRRVA